MTKRVSWFHQQTLKIYCRGELNMVQDAKRIVLLLIICLMTFIVSGCSDNIKKEVESQALDLAKAQTYSTAQITKTEYIESENKYIVYVYTEGDDKYRRFQFKIDEKDSNGNYAITMHKGQFVDGEFVAQ